MHLVRDPRTFPIGGLHEKERRLQRKYFGEERWEKLTKKFEQEWEHLKKHKQMRNVKKEDVIDLLRTTAHWTAVNLKWPRSQGRTVSQPRDYFKERRFGPT